MVIKILDCTLRDGGYVNDWNFGKSNINLTLNKLTEADIDIIECGFLKKIDYNESKSLFDKIDRFKKVMPNERKNSKFVCMINYGEYGIDDIPENTGQSIDGIRLVFHKKNLEEAIIYGEKLSQKGYLLFIQPMVTINYTDKELIYLIDKVNKINPYAFYIVDSFGVMKKNDLIRMSYLIDNNLNHKICLGYHSHNNLQLAYSNAQNFIEVATERTKIIDSSIYGMGRGAGNLNTELFVEYLNEYKGKSYNVEPLLEVIDEVLEKIYLEKKWGYSLPYYLSAKWNCHPNYGLYLEKLGTLTVRSINKILSSIGENKRDSYNQEYIHKLYIQYQSHNLDDSNYIKKLKKVINGREILVVAPGQNFSKERDKVNLYIKEKQPFIITINFQDKELNPNLVFVSNEKRYGKLNNKKNMIVTSNIEVTDSNVIKFNYQSLLGEDKKVEDNAGLMLMRLLKKIQVEKVLLVGLDGYSYNNEENYIEGELSVFKTIDQVDELNEAISKELIDIAKGLKLEFLTANRYNI